MLKVVADSKIPFLKGALEPVASVVYMPGSEISSSHLAHADALIVRTRTRCNESLLAGTRVRFIATATIGFDHIDRSYCQKAGVSWTNAPGCNSGSVQQYIASALCHIARRDRRPLASYTIGIVGVGHVGSRVERLARTLGMRVLLNDPPREEREGAEPFVSLSTILEQSDIVTLHVPLSLSGQHPTHHLANDDFFSRVRRGAWFINASRGEVVKTSALQRAIDTGSVGGTVLDVWENEPELNLNLLQSVSIATPHIAGYSLDGKANGTAQSVQAVSRFFGLGMDNWYPSGIPLPTNPTITVQANGDIMNRLILHTYDISTDSNALKANPELFERLRDGYPPRREFGAYSVRVSKAIQPFEAVIKGLGFGIFK